MINQKDLDFYNQNRFSLTNAQSVSTTLSVNGSIWIKKALMAGKTVVVGKIKPDV